MPLWLQVLIAAIGFAASVVAAIGAAYITVRKTRKRQLLQERYRLKCETGARVMKALWELLYSMPTTKHGEAFNSVQIRLANDLRSEMGSVALFWSDHAGMKYLVTIQTLDKLGVFDSPQPIMKSDGSLIIRKLQALMNSIRDEVGATELDDEIDKIISKAKSFKTDDQEEE